MKLSEFQSGIFETQYEYESFLPSKVNHAWIIDSPNLLQLLGEADRALGELNAYSDIVPDIEFFIETYVAKEAILSSKIEGTQTNMEDAFKDIEDVAPNTRDDWQEVQNYIRAINFAINSLDELPLCNRLLLSTHEMLMKSVRGKEKMPGEFRTSQNWIGVSLKNAVFIPPHEGHITNLMQDLEAFLNEEKHPIPPLMKIGIAHYQFETIHPFLDGNGRLGRLMISLFLASKKLLSRPALYLSDYFERNKTAYVDHLMAVRQGNHIHEWLTFFLQGVLETAEDAASVFREIIALRQKVDGQVLPHFSPVRQHNVQRLMQHLYRRPVITIEIAADLINSSRNTGATLLKDLVERGVLTEITGQKRNQLFVFGEYLRLFR